MTDLVTGVINDGSSIIDNFIIEERGKLVF